MHTLFLLNPTAGKTDCTQQLPQQINAAAARAGLAPEEYTIRITTHAGHARELARAAAAGAQQAGEPLRIFTAGGDGTFNEALTGAYGLAAAILTSTVTIADTVDASVSPGARITVRPKVEPEVIRP